MISVKTHTGTVHLLSTPEAKLTLCGYKIEGIPRQSFTDVAATPPTCGRCKRRLDILLAEQRKFEKLDLSAIGQPKPTRITEAWLLERGWKIVSEPGEDRRPHRHYLLWMGDRVPQHRPGRRGDYEDLGLELTKGDNEGSCWHCWFRSDVAGRYSKFIHVRYFMVPEQLERFYQALTDRRLEKVR